MDQSSILFKWVCFFTPWTVIGISSPLVSNLPIALLLALCDLKFILGILNRLSFKIIYEINKYDLIFIIIILYFIFEDSYKNQIWGIFISLYFIAYIIKGPILKAERYAGIGLLSCILFGLVQFLSIQYFQSDALSNQRIFELINVEYFGIYQISGSIARSQIFEELFRVSGGASEPALFSMTIFLLSNCVKINNYYKYIGYFISLSKVTIIYILVDSIRIFRKHAIVIMLSITIVIIYYFQDTFINLDIVNLYSLDHSSYIRLLPAFYLLNIDLHDLLFGIGRGNFCNAIHDIFFYGSVMDADWCQGDAGSFLGSILIEKGVIGLFLFLLIPYLIYKKMNNVPLKCYYSCLVIYIMGTLNIHYLTFFAPALFYIGNVLGRMKSNSPYCGVFK